MKVHLLVKNINQNICLAAVCSKAFYDVLSILKSLASLLYCC